MSADALTTRRQERLAGKLSLLGMPAANLVELFETLDEKPYRARQVMKWLYQRHVTDFGAMTDLERRAAQAARRDRDRCSCPTC